MAFVRFPLRWLEPHREKKSSRVNPLKCLNRNCLGLRRWRCIWIRVPTGYPVTRVPDDSRVAPRYPSPNPLEVCVLETLTAFSDIVQRVSGRNGEGYVTGDTQTTLYPGVPVHAGYMSARVLASDYPAGDRSYPYPNG